MATECSRKSNYAISRANGYEVETASSTARANQHMERHEFSVALVNLTLPDGDGVRLFRLLKSRDPSLEVILMTGSCPPTLR